MKAKGISRKIGELGRIVIPMEIRKNLNIEENTKLDIIQRGNSVIVTVSNDKTCECGAVLYDNFKYCPICGKEI